MADVGILGDDAVRGNPAGMDGVARFLDQTAASVAKIRAELSSNTLDGKWEGAAAEAFQKLVKDLPDELGKAERSYELASTTVQGYARQLRTAHDKAIDLARRLEDAQRREQAAATANANASRSADQARSAHSDAEPADQAQARNALDAALRSAVLAQQGFSAVQGEIEQIKRDANDNRSELDRTARSAREKLSEASHLGMRDSAWSWTKRHFGPLAGVVWDVAKWAGKTFIDAVTLPLAFYEFLKDPSWAAFSKLLDHVAAALTVAAIVLIIAGTIFTGGALAAALPAIIAGLKWAQVGVAGAKLGVDSWRKFGEGEDVSYADLANDVVGLGLAGRSIGGKTSTYMKASRQARSQNAKIARAEAQRTSGRSHRAQIREGRIDKKVRAAEHRRHRILVDAGVIKETTRETIEDQAKQYGKSRAIATAREGGKAFAGWANPALGPTTTEEQVKRLMAPGSIQIRHQLMLPALRANAAGP